MVLDRLGFGPITTPSRVAHAGACFRMHAYQAAGAGGPAILIVPAPIKSAYIWDLAPGASVVERMRSSGMQVYLVAWQRPGHSDQTKGLEAYAERAIGECSDIVARESGHAKMFFAGHSLGGTLAAIFASLHPERVQGLIALEAPIEFGAGRLEAAVAIAPPASAIAGALGNVPGSFLDLASAYADPLTFGAEPWIDGLQSSASSAQMRLHWQVRRWTLDETPMARRLYEEVQEALYRENRFVLRRLSIGERLADPHAIRAPIFAVMDSRSRIVPPPAVEAYRTRTMSKDVRIVDYPGDRGVVMQHVGVLVGKNAHRSLWPRIGEWIQRHAPQRS